MQHTWFERLSAGSVSDAQPNAWSPFSEQCKTASNKQEKVASRNSQIQGQLNVTK